MVIRKEFRVESSHIVRNCTSHRCSHSVHGHSAVIEVMLEGSKLDNAGMLYDFGLMKSTIKQFIDSSDHCHLIWSKDKESYKEFFKDTNDRWIEVPFNPSAENLSMYYMRGIQNIIDHTIMMNGEDPGLRVKGVRYHETTTGWAECSKEDIDNLWNPEWDSHIVYSEGVTNDWSDDLMDIIYDGTKIENPKIRLQVAI